MDKGQVKQSLVRTTNRVNVGEAHDGAVCSTAENRRKHKVGETTERQETKRVIESGSSLRLL